MAKRRNALTSLAVLVLYFSLSRAQTSFIYSMEYQIKLEDGLFDDGRGQGIDVYISAWSQVTGVDTSGFQATETYRTETSTNLGECDSNAAIRIREYISGDLEGLVTVNIKAVQDGLSQEEAEEEPFAPSEAYEDVSERQIERDIHPCQADYSANTRLFLDTAPALETCADVAAIFPDAVTSSNATIGLGVGGPGVTYLYILNGTYNGFPVDLTTEITYTSFENAVSDTNPNPSEFSYTMLGANGRQASFSASDIAAADADYFDIIDIVGSPGEFPCEDDSESAISTNISPSSNNSPSTNNSPSSGSSGGSSSSDNASTLVVPSALLLLAWAVLVL